MGTLPDFITFTGLDARTDLDRARALSERYPIEWGVLFSKNRQGKNPRYPEADTLSRIIWRDDLRKAAHICGRYSADVMNGLGIGSEFPVDLAYFNRVQVNHASPNPAQIVSFRNGWGKFRCIAQSRGETFPKDTSVDWLHDLSGGTGAAPASWPPYPGRFVGYAGGISPENVELVIQAIGADGHYWIDMESGVRTDDWLDLDKCEAVCRAVFPSPSNQGEGR